MLQRLASVRHNRYAGAVAAGSLAGLVLLLFFLLVRGQRDTVILHVQPIDDPSVIRVYVGGDVTSPGLISLQRGSRVADAIAAAGGLLTSADTSGLGMAAVLKDADQIIVPSRRPTPSSSAPQPGVPLTGDSPDSSPVADPGSNPYPLATQAPQEVRGPIDINSAPESELDLLPGIGPAIAARIIEYRLEHGPFQTLEELAEVSGISARMVEDLRPLITLGN